MTLLYLNTTYHVEWALVDEVKRIYHFSSLSHQKASQGLHQDIHQILKKYNLSLIKDVSALLVCIGPGFYTGIRVAQVFSDFISLANIKTLPFYTYEWPLVLGEKKYLWITKAYRGELFLYSFDHGIARTRLISEKDHRVINEYRDYIIYAPNFDMIESILETQQISYKRIEINQNNLVRLYHFCQPRKMASHPFYFRLAEDEFKVSKR